MSEEDGPVTATKIVYETSKFWVKRFKGCGKNPYKIYHELRQLKGLGAKTKSMRTTVLTLAFAITGMME